MPRATSTFKTEAGKDELAPILLVRILDMPEVLVPATKHSLYLTDCDQDPTSGSREAVSFFDENGDPQIYLPCGLSYEQCEASMDSSIESVQVSVDNVDRSFSALAQYVILNGVTVHVLRAFRNLLYTEDGAQLIFSGRIRQALINEHSIQLAIWADYSLKKRAPRRMYWINDFPYIPASKDVREIMRIDQG